MGKWVTRSLNIRIKPAAGINIPPDKSNFLPNLMQIFVYARRSVYKFSLRRENSGTMSF
jgi:hypothetical protein